MKKLLKLNLPEMIWVLLSTQKQSIIWLDNIGYIINQWYKIVKDQDVTWFQKVGRTKKVIRVGKISGKYDIITVEEER